MFGNYHLSIFSWYSSRQAAIIYNLFHIWTNHVAGKKQTTKIKATTIFVLTNQSKPVQHDEPMRTRSKFTVAGAQARENTCDQVAVGSARDWLNRLCVYFFFFLLLVVWYLQAELDQYSSALLDTGADLAPLEYIKKWRSVLTKHIKLTDAARCSKRIILAINRPNFPLNSKQEQEILYRIIKISCCFVVICHLERLPRLL